MASEQYPQGHPMMAQPAMQQGRLLANNLIKIINKKNLNHSNTKTKVRWQPLEETKQLSIYQNSNLVAFLHGLFGCLCIYFR